MAQLVTYQWTDGFPGQPPPFLIPHHTAPGSAPSYFATATGFAGQPHMQHDAPWCGQQGPLSYAQPLPPPPLSPQMGPPYMGYPGYDRVEQQWMGLPGQLPSVPPLQAPAAASAPPYSPPDVGSPLPPTDQLAHGMTPPPAEEPKLPEAVQLAEESLPPPPGAPRLPPAVQAHEQEGLVAPPPMSSPKLPKDLTMALGQQMPPAPGDSPS